MRLPELDPQFLKRAGDHGYREINDITEADGISFLCPVCFLVNDGPEGTHSIICWQPHVPDNVVPRPGRWKFLGSGYNDLELHNKNSSIELKDGCKAHFKIKNGVIEFC